MPKALEVSCNMQYSKPLNGGLQLITYDMALKAIWAIVPTINDHIALKGRGGLGAIVSLPWVR
jgi:hypothetical protein